MDSSITLEMLRDALHPGIFYAAPGKVVVPQWLYDAAPPEWKPHLIVSEKMPEPTAAERGVLNRYQDRRRKRG